MGEREDALARIAELEAENVSLRAERDRYKAKLDELRGILAHSKTSLNESMNDPMVAQ